MTSTAVSCAASSTRTALCRALRRRASACGLAQSDLPRLQAVQRMLLRLGIASTLYRDRRPAGSPQTARWPRRAAPIIRPRPQHELVISRREPRCNSAICGLRRPRQGARLDIALAAYKRALNRERFVATRRVIVEDGVEDVFDVQHTRGQRLRRQRPGCAQLRRAATAPARRLPAGLDQSGTPGRQAVHRRGAARRGAARGAHRPQPCASSTTPSTSPTIRCRRRRKRPRPSGASASASPGSPTR